MSGSNAGGARGLTLLEVVISIALIALLLGSLLTFFWETLLVRDHVALALDRTQIVRQVLERMSAELRATLPYETVHFPVARFNGDRRRVTFLTTPLPHANTNTYAYSGTGQEVPWPQHDLYEVTYELWVDPEDTTDEGEPLVGGILRTQRQAIQPMIPEDEVPEGEDVPYVRRDLWCHELGYLEFRYFDGVEWTTRWEVAEGNPLPQMMQITVGFDSLTRSELDDQDLSTYPIERYPLGPDVPNPDRYSMIVRFPAADPMFTSRVQRLANDIDEVYQFMTGTGGEASGPTGGTP